MRLGITFYSDFQAVRTNVIGTENVLDSAIEHGVKNMVVLSTDKAAYPINAMGISKEMKQLLLKLPGIREDKLRDL
ncbi:MAG: UDP-N-acetylglucosamine 4,6-dehydratase/5-epimerase [Pseudothermotoga sp.]|uniref:polysaccharide biosynthesis protein n=1 Tax=Pseudothermotoga sp. TaxID=2033661 RepID=UPI0024AA6F37|nr:polysaccharide biosynthesis protein [Pseudothermotoga sp.]MDI3495708.1 UDP-N-acetylglucosamine 4,6-dehydratase/5-epimerase [Pseudothermotoga sp.]